MPTIPISDAKARLAALVREVAITGELSVPASFLNDFGYAVESDGFRILELDAVSAIGAGQIRGDHRDPFDRLLAAQAAALDGALVTNDPMCVAMGVEVCW